MTPVLAMTVVREASIAAFTPEKFHTVDLELTSGCTASSKRFAQKADAELLLSKCRKEGCVTVQKMERKEKSESPPQLYDLTALQRDANRLLGFTAQQTLDYAQSLYEKRLITYPRTDSRFLTEDMAASLPGLVTDTDRAFAVEEPLPIEEMQERVDAATARYHEMGDSIKASEKRLAEIAVLKAHIVNYAKTRLVYDAYRKAGYSKRFLESHRAEITLHKAAKAAFDEANLKTLPKIKELDAEYSKLLTEKKALYPDYRKVKEEMQELLRAKRNVELFFAEEKSSTEKTKSR